MKKIIAILLALAMLLSFAACTPRDKAPDGSTDTGTDDGTGNPGGNTEKPGGTNDGGSGTGGTNDGGSGTGGTTVTPEYVEKEETVYVCVNSVKVRTSPDRTSDANVKTYISYCTVVKRVADNGIWSKVDINGEILYVSSDCLTTDDLTAPGFTEVNQVVVATGNVHIRRGPSTSTESLGILYRGECIERIGVNENWSKVLFEGKECFIYAEYLIEFELEDPDDPEVPENPDDPEVPENPDDPDDPDNPEIPDAPENPDNPENPENPNPPENPDDPENPEPPTSNNIKFRTMNLEIKEINAGYILAQSRNGLYYRIYSLLFSFDDVEVGETVTVSYLVRSKRYQTETMYYYNLYAVGYSAVAE